tara:strand:- start:119 stop:1801 length:1683 start_codon:yes stop_codon:yes gene_type:complete
MCGIFSLLNGDIDNTKLKIYNHASKNKKRGPEVEKFLCYEDNVFMMFHRLAINGLDDSGNQPLLHKKLVVIGNGEIYNYKHLIEEYNLTPKSESDIEVLLHLYEIMGTKFIHEINGEYSFILYDSESGELLVARDQFGVRPLYYNYTSRQTLGKDLFCFSSTLSSIVDINELDNKNIRQFPPGNIMTLKKNENRYFEFKNLKPYIKLPTLVDHSFLKTNTSRLVYNSLKDSIKRRILTSERPVGALLSGGLDSSLVCALSQEILKENNKPPLVTFSIGLPNSEDLKFSSEVAKHIGSNHHQIIMNQEEFLSAIPSVIYDIESYDTTTVRASTGNWLIGKYIKENTDVKVILNGDGADELMGGYLYFHKTPNDYIFDNECKRLLSDIHYFDVLRSDRCIASHGLEPRTPMLDKNFVENYLSISITERSHISCSDSYGVEKYLIRKSVEKENPNLLPKSILWRQKEAFSDGVSSLQKSWYEIIQDHIKEVVEKDKDLCKEIESTIYPSHLNCSSIEQKYYYIIFNKNYKYCSHLIPYYWMPNFVDATDSSARTLKSVYNKNK